jgi:hypothetical protein
MSVNVHEFKVLDDEMTGGAELVLIDLRPDWIEKDKGEQTGLILHHPRLERGKLARLDQRLLDRINEANPMGVVDFDSRKHFIDDEGYMDPLASDPSEPYWGAFEPVRYEVGDVQAGAGPKDRVGWVVLVQKPMLP